MLRLDCMIDITKQLTRQLKKYELNPTEKKLFDHILKSQAKTVREIESDFRMSRTKVTYTLSKLCDRGLIYKTIVGKKYVYRVRKDLTDQSPEILSIVEVMYKIRTAKHTKLYGIQSDGAVAHLVKAMEMDSLNFEKVHRVQKQRSVIIEALISKKSLKLIQEISPRLKKSHSGRPSIFYIIENQIKGNTDIYFDQSTVYIVDYAMGQGTVLHNTNLSTLLVQLFEIIKLSANKISAGDVYKVL